MQALQFDYFHGMEAEQYSFYRVPKVLFSEECFRPLSCEAKVLYGLMLDRMGLSMKNRWFDDEDRVYIIFTVEEIMELMDCKSQKATKLLKELDTEDGIGLIERKRQGLGKPNVIYVKNFIINDIEQTEESEVESCTDQQNFGNRKLGISEIKNPEFPESKIQNFENQKSRVLKIKNQEFPKSKTNKTDRNDTDRNDTDDSDTDNPILSYPIISGESISMDGYDRMGQMDRYRRIIRENIGYERHPQEEVDELVELIVEVMTMPEGNMVRIAGEDKPVEVVKSRFMNLGHSHIEYVLFALEKNTTKVANIKSYLLTALYNAPLTIKNYYKAEVNHDMYGGGY